MIAATQVSGPTEDRTIFQRLYNSVGFKRRYNFFLCEYALSLITAIRSRYKGSSSLEPCSDLLSLA